MIQAVPISDCIAPVESQDPVRTNPKGTFRYIDLSSVDKDQKVVDANLVQNIETKDAPSRARQVVKVGDILVSTVRPNLNGVAIVPEELNGATASTGYCVLRCNERLDPLYLYYWVQTPDFVSDMVRKATGANYPAVTDRVIKTSTIPLPPLETQKHIARVLEQADQLRKQAQLMESELNQLAQSLFLEMFGDPISNIKGLDTAAITDCFDIKTGKLDSNAAVVGGRYPFFTCAREDFWIDEYAFDQKAILLAGNNASADYSVKYFEGKFNAYQRTYVFSLKNDDWSYQYFKAALEFQLSNLKTSSKGTNTKYLTMEIFRRIFLQVPAAKVQREFEDRMQKINLEKSKTQSLHQQIDGLFESLMQRAFKGNLTAPGSKAA